MKIGASLLFSKEECLYLRQNCGLPSTRVRSNMKRHIICDPCQTFRPFQSCSPLTESIFCRSTCNYLYLSISLNISHVDSLNVAFTSSMCVFARRSPRKTFGAPLAPLPDRSEMCRGTALTTHLLWGIQGGKAMGRCMYIYI